MGKAFRVFRAIQETAQRTVRSRIELHEQLDVMFLEAPTTLTLVSLQSIYQLHRQIVSIACSELIIACQLHSAEMPPILNR